MNTKIMTPTGFVTRPAIRQEFATKPLTHTQIAERSAAIQAAFPCIHRSDQLRIESRIGGCSVADAPVYECSEFGECTLWKFCRNQKQPVCTSCQTRKESIE